MLRNPYDYVLSRYWHRYKARLPEFIDSLEDYIPELASANRTHPWKSVVGMYREYVDRYFLFEDGLEAFFRAVGLEHVEIPTIGQVRAHAFGPRLQIDSLPRKYKLLIDTHFAEELELYKLVKKERHQHA